MSEVEVQPEKLRAFGKMFGKAADEVESTNAALDVYFSAVGADATVLTAYGLLNALSCGIGEEVVTFHSRAEGALNRSKEVLLDMAEDYENIDAENADEVGSTYREDEHVAKNANPDEEKGSSKKKTNLSVNEKDFEYVVYGRTWDLDNDAAKAEDPWVTKPHEHLDIPEFKEYPEAVKWAATWGMNLLGDVMVFVGDWQKAKAAAGLPSSIAGFNGAVAGNIVENNVRIAESWTGESSEASQKFMVWLADNIAGCDNTLSTYSYKLGQYIEEIDEIAAIVAGYISWIIWEADWALELGAPSGPINPAMPDVTVQDVLSGITKAQQAEYLKSSGDWEFKNFSSWADSANKYVTGAYAGMLGGILQQYLIMSDWMTDVWTKATDLIPAMESVNTDLAEASERLEAFHHWGKDSGSTG